MSEGEFFKPTKWKVILALILFVFITGIFQSITISMIIYLKVEYLIGYSTAFLKEILGLILQLAIFYTLSCYLVVKWDKWGYVKKGFVIGIISGLAYTSWMYFLYMACFNSCGGWIETFGRIIGYLNIFLLLRKSGVWFGNLEVIIGNIVIFPLIGLLIGFIFKKIKQNNSPDRTNFSDSYLLTFVK